MHSQESTPFEKSPELVADQLMLVGRLTASTSHRINNLLHRINSGEYLLDLGIQKNDFGKISRGWAIIKPAQSRVSMVMANLLLLSQTIESFCRSTSLLHIVELAQDQISDAFGADRFIVRHEITNDCEAELDAQHVGIAVQNIASIGLIGNDGKDEDEKCQVQLTISKCDHGLEFLFRFENFDNDRNLPSFLDGEVRIDKAERGMLEMVVAKKIVQAHGGTLKIKPAANNEAVVEIVFQQS